MHFRALILGLVLAVSATPMGPFNPQALSQRQSIANDVESTPSSIDVAKRSQDATDTIDIAKRANATEFSIDSIDIA